MSSELSLDQLLAHSANANACGPLLQPPHYSAHKHAIAPTVLLILIGQAKRHNSWTCQANDNSPSFSKPGMSIPIQLSIFQDLFIFSLSISS